MKFRRFFARASNPHKLLGDLNFYGSGKNVGNWHMAQSRHFGCPSRSRSQHWNPGGARCLSSASVAQMLAAASIKVMDALFGLVAQNDAETYTSFIFIVTKLEIGFKIVIKKLRN